jgi:RNA-directed DNA polymerase
MDKKIVALWNSYAFRFKMNAKLHYLSEDYIETCLKYAKLLFENNVPVIFDIHHFSALVGYDVRYICGVTNDTNKFYRTFKIKKRSGKLRIIDEPLPSLKEIQKWILKNILNNIDPSKYSMAFIAGSSIKDNAKYHRKQNYVLSLDIKDFFPSINTTKIYRVYKKLGYTNSVAYLLSKLCVKEDALPQGAPTSPALSNLICWRIDLRISGYAEKHKLQYTRYADDITISGDFNPKQLVKFIIQVLKDDGFDVNYKKTRVLRPYQRQIVTGIVVNQNFNIERDKRKLMRQELYYIKKFGLASHMEKKNISKDNYFEHLKGKIAYMKHINPEDKVVRDAMEYFNERSNMDIQ